jgi:hypothetical protein
VLGFFLLIGLVFWISSLHDLPDYQALEPSPHGAKHPTGHLVLGGAHPSAVTELRGLPAQDVEGS